MAGDEQADDLGRHNIWHVHPQPSASAPYAVA